MIKKLLMVGLAVLFLLPNVFAGSFRNYLGKNVEVCVIDNCYQGNVIDIIEAEICRQRDPLTESCIDVLKLYTLILRTEEGRIVVIACERITKIREIK